VKVNNLPGGDLIATGLADLAHGDETVEAMLVAIGGPRLRRLGFPVPDTVADPEERLYRLLARTMTPARTRATTPLSGVW
jgi:hypothetical protein